VEAVRNAWTLLSSILGTAQERPGPVRPGRRAKYERASALVVVQIGSDNVLYDNAGQQHVEPDTTSMSVRRISAKLAGAPD
jgi:hypothetical protein